MIRRPPRSTRTDTLCPYTTLFRSLLLALALPAGAETLRIDGEVYARTSAQIMPPTVEGMWQFNITRLAPDGAPLEKGAVAVAFDASTVLKSLAEKNSKLQEKQRELDRLQLELAERERSSHLETEKARAELEKAARKTEQPQELIAGIEYRKLVVARKQAERKLALARELESANAEQRAQELRLVRSEIAQLTADVARFGKAQADLTIAAPRSGILMHRSSWHGDKFRSEEHTSELQSLMRISYAVFCLKTKTKTKSNYATYKQYQHIYKHTIKK